MQNKKIILWSLVAVAIIGVIFGLVKLAAKNPRSDNPDSLALTVSAVNDNENIKGNKESKISFIEYSDFQCPACGSYYPLLKQMNEEFKDKIKFAYRHFPLARHENARAAASAAEAAGRQDKFWEMHDKIFQNQSDWSKEKDAMTIFAKYALELNLDLDKFRKDAASKEVKNKINADYESGVKAVVNSTPSFFLNGKKIINPRNYEELRNLLLK